MRSALSHHVLLSQLYQHLLEISVIKRTQLIARTAAKFLHSPHAVQAAQLVTRWVASLVNECAMQIAEAGLAHSSIASFARIATWLLTRILSYARSCKALLGVTRVKSSVVRHLRNSAF